MTLFSLALYAPMMAQSNDQAGKTAKKDKLEQRSQNKSDQSNDHTGADRFGRRGDSTRPHFGGKQGFQGRLFHGGYFKGPQNFRESYMYRGLEPLHVGEPDRAVSGAGSRGVGGGICMANGGERDEETAL